MDASDDQRPLLTPTVISVVLAVAGVVAVLVAVTALLDWRWSLLTAGAVLVYAGYVASTVEDGS